jgi:hypothetical protein
MDPTPPILNYARVPDPPTERPPTTENLRTPLNHQYAAVRTPGMPMNKEACSVTPLSPWLTLSQTLQVPPVDHGTSSTTRVLVDPTPEVARRIALMENDEEEEILGVTAALSTTLEVSEEVEVEFCEDFDPKDFAETYLCEGVQQDNHLVHQRQQRRRLHQTQVQARTNAPMHVQRLIFDVKFMEDTQTNIGKEWILHLSLSDASSPCGVKRLRDADATGIFDKADAMAKFRKAIDGKLYNAGNVGTLGCKRLQGCKLRVAGCKGPRVGVRSAALETAVVLHFDGSKLA